MMSLFKCIQIIFCFFLVFSYEYERVYISNIVLLLLFVLLTVNNPNLHNSVKKRTSITLISFLLFVTLSTLLYSYQNASFEVRNIVQYIFNFQYFLLIYYLDLDYELIKKWIIKFSCLYVFLLLLVFFFIESSIGDFKSNLIIVSYFPGWPNSIPLIFLTAAFLTRNMRFSWLYLLVFLFAIILTGSRGGLLGIMLVILLPFYVNYKKLIITITSIFIFILLFSFNSFNLADTSPDNRLLRSYDRLDIFMTTYSLIKERPLLGYGGNTIDQLQNIKIDHSPLINWGHTHNLLLEILLRYGIIGLFLFSLFMYYRMKDIKLKEYRYMFSVLLILALFQIFIRDFIFLYLLIFYSNYSIYLQKLNK